MQHAPKVGISGGKNIVQCGRCYGSIKLYKCTLHIDYIVAMWNSIVRNIGDDKIVASYWLP